MWLQLFILILGVSLGLSAWLYFVNAALSTPPEEANKLAGKPWSDNEIREAYEKCRKERPSFEKDIPPKQNRRYVVFGGSGLVGGWMVEHLIIRGEAPGAIRIVDLQAPRRELAVKHGVQHFNADITNRASVDKAFAQPWSAEYANLPLTVLHTVAYIHAGYSDPDFLDKYVKVNVEGTKNVLGAAKQAGCDIFISTSSSSISIKPINFFFRPWQRYPSNYVQVQTNAEPQSLDRLENFAGCYAYTKALAEKLVMDANNEGCSFRTGVIRPGHSIYGHGDDNPSSLVYNYVSRGGLPTWITHNVLQFVSAQNVSLAHLQYEARLLEGRNIGGNAYCVTDPNPPVRYGDLYRACTLLAHPSTPIKFPTVPTVPILLVCHMMRAYILLRHRYLPFLPAVTNFDLQHLQPAMLNYSTGHFLYDDSRARKELGYASRHDTLEGVCLHLLEWNEKVEQKLREKGEVPEEATVVEKNVPVVRTG